jgi:hypothetical protein
MRIDRRFKGIRAMTTVHGGQHMVGDGRRAQLAGGAVSYRAVTAVIAWSGLLLQCYLSLTRSVSEGQSLAEGLVFFFGYFTITTNLLVAAALTVPLVAPNSKTARSLTAPFTVAGIATSIGFVSLAYHVLLHSLWNPQGVHLLADDILHYATPALFLLYWFVYMREGSLRWIHPLAWGIYPTVYFVYVMVRGGIIGSYPYGFIDVNSLGYPQTLLNAVGLLVVFIVIGFGIVAVDRAVRRFAPGERRGTAPS